MPIQETTYVRQLSPEDRVVVHFQTEGKRVIEFSAQFEIVFNGRWRPVIGYDNSHEEPHKHIHNPDGTDYVAPMNILDANQAFTSAMDTLKAKFLIYHQEYIIKSERMGDA